MVDPIVGVLVTIILLLAGWGYADHQRRIGKLEDHVRDHDKWAGGKAEELATVKEGLRSIIQRLDRQDGILDQIRSSIDKLMDRIGGRRTS